ncbi:TPA: metallophosphatase family protein [Candidatus Sumerlaeota bacterium]|jgi:predicted phosphodiesterase|nr:metallophosphatase family protein [Candidatus Sumerlaeota bacterium]
MTTNPLSRFVVFSDVHANLSALQTFFEVAGQENYDSYFCLGDIVGYGARPNECCDLIRTYEPAISVVMGNHDWVALHPEESDAFNEIAREAILWTGAHLTQVTQKYLAKLPFKIEEEDFMFVHASPHEPEHWNYVITRDDAVLCFATSDAWITFVGHSHHPFMVEQQPDGALASVRPDEIQLRRDYRYLVNVGSVGQPRDQNSALCYVSVDVNEDLLHFHRVSYPIVPEQEAIKAAGLPIELAERLGQGW